MFSGIIEEKTRVKNITKTPHGRKLTVESKIASKDIKVGDSISVNGVCLTVIGVKEKNVSFDVMEETLRRTNLANLSVRNSVNLERALKASDRISGHFVTGHVDCIGGICAVTKRQTDHAIEIKLPKEKIVYVVEKGSVAIDGVSLTVAEIKSNRIKIYLIPLTLKMTNFGSKKAGDSVNIEFDILGKYALKKPQPVKRRINTGFLKEHGFL